MLGLFTALVLVQICCSSAQQSCPALGNLPFASPSCEWVVDVDQRGCRFYGRDCGQRSRRCFGNNEVLWRCSSNCEPTCSNRNPICDRSCGPPKCQCVGGYFRDPSGRCVRANQCPAVQPPRCGTNEYFATCSTLCEPTCSNMNPACWTMCGPPKCQCRGGFVRNDRGLCVPRNACPVSAPVCPRNEEFVQCSTECEPTCFTRPNAPCHLSCGPPKCQCRPGFVRSNRGCIPRNQCFPPRNF